MVNGNNVFVDDVVVDGFVAVGVEYIVEMRTLFLRIDHEVKLFCGCCYCGCCGCSGGVVIEAVAMNMKTGLNLWK